ncbi:hypothetical protein HDV05_006078, partial [Chytridiales sp. JEL 0842]
ARPREQEAVEIEQQNLVAWQEERGKLYTSAVLAKEAYNPEVELELSQLKGTTEKFTVVTSLSPYMVNPAFHRYISDVVVRCSALPPTWQRGKPLFRKCLYAFSQEDSIDVRPDNEEDLLLRQCLEDFKDLPWYENDRMAVNFHENIVRNLYPRLLNYFKMGLSSLAAFMLKEVGGLPEDVGNLELDVVWRAEGEDQVDEEIAEQVVDGFMMRRGMNTQRF